MNWRKSFPGRVFKVGDLDYGAVGAALKIVGNENVGGENADQKLVVRFVETAIKSLVCNLTRAEAISEIAGSEDTDQWPGTTVQLVKGQTRYQGRKVGCITVQKPPRLEHENLVKDVA
jgi:hypothetical protein